MLQYITHYTDQRDYIEGLAMALYGGCRWIQLRVKEGTDEEILPLALQTQIMCQQANATFIIDDRVELVRQIKADGVHLGQNDMPIAEARKLLGPDYIIGGTANTFEQVKAHYQASADYVGIGPFRFTQTKKKLAPVLGLEGYRSIVQQMRQEHIDLPVVAIGGITLADVPDLMATGISGIAVSGSILRAENPIEYTQQLIKQLQSNE